MEGNSGASNLPLVRRLEAVGLRAWPAASVQYDGSWQIRLTGGLASKRLNCVVALDPHDIRDVAIRLEKAERKFLSYGRPLIVRQTPLTPPPLIDLLVEQGWQRFEEVVTMTADLSALELPDTLDHLPSHDIGRFVDASLAVQQEDAASKPGLAEVVTAIKPPSGLFVIEDAHNLPVASVLCVQDNDLAGIMMLTVAQSQRRKGVATEILSAALRWARMRGARTAWLQVETGNAAALSLYARLGFREAFHYYYWRKEPHS
ncbi:MAG: GNAT family N-acetyltransferase [Allorhizobium sp.]